MRTDSEIKSLTGLRGVAACLVMLYHYFPSEVNTGLVANVLRHGYIAVDLFFVLSGFVLALTYGRVFRTGFRFEVYRTFLYKRLGRVYPLYLVVTLLAVLMACTGTGQCPTAWEVVSNVLLIQAWGFAPSIGGPTWSISTEFAAYVLFPALTVAVLAGRLRWSVLSGVAAVAALMFVATRSTLDVHQLVAGVASRNGPLDVFGAGTPYPLLRCLAGFILGLLAFRMMQSSAVQRLAGWHHAANIVVAAIFGLMMVPGSDVVLVLMFVPLVAALATERSWSSRVLSSAVLYWLGLVSYSIYLVHRLADQAFRDAIKSSLNQWQVPHAFSVSGLVMIVLTLLLSIVGYYLVERPGRDWSRRLLGRRLPAAVPGQI